MNTTNTTIRIDKDLKKKAEELFADFGLSFSAAVTMFLKQAVREQAIPFAIRMIQPNEATLKAIEEVEAMEKDPSKAKTFESMDAFLKDLNS